MRTILTLILLVVLGVGLTVGLLYATDQLNTKGNTAEAAPPAKVEAKLPEGMIRVLVAPRELPAYHRITRDDLLPDPRFSKFLEVTADPKNLPSDALITHAQIEGRVLRRNKPAFFVFTEDDFYPVGTRAGIVAGVPAGKRAMVLDAAQVRGVHQLNLGDHLDLLATLPWELDRAKFSPEKLPGTVVEDQQYLGDPNRKATMKRLVSNGVLIQPATLRDKMVQTKDGTKSIQVEEIVIAVNPEEVPALLEALTLKADILCLARSGRPDADENESEIPIPTVDVPNFSTIERMIGGTKTSIVAPSKPGDPVNE